VVFLPLVSYARSEQQAQDYNNVVNLPRQNASPWWTRADPPSGHTARPPQCLWCPGHHGDGQGRDASGQAPSAGAL